MVGTILPIGYGERRQGRPPFAVTLHVVSYFAGAATAGALIGWLGLLIHPPLARLSPEALLGLLAIAASLHDAGLIRVPFPEAKRQVPARLRFALTPWRLALAYGFELGTGLTTFGSTAAFYVVLAIAIVVGSPLTAVVILLPYAAGRALPFLYFAVTTQSPVESAARMRSIVPWQSLARLATALALSVFAGSLLANTFG